MKKIFLFLLLAFSFKGNTQMTLNTLYETSESEINLYIVSQGFTSNCMSSFNSFVTNYLAYMWSIAPYSTMQSKFRVIRVQIPSAQENVPGAYFQFDGIPSNQLSNYICTNDSNPCIGASDQYLQNECSSDFKSRMDDLKTQLPGFDNKSYILAVFNNNYYTGGGGEYTFVSTFCNHSYMYKVLLHEFSHTFGLLGDEYDPVVSPNIAYLHDENCAIVYDSSNNPIVIDGDTFPLFHNRNVTTITTPADIPWKYLIQSGTPLPTCDASGSLPNCTNSTIVGLFEGANYELTGWYRSQKSCTMRDLNANSFCQVCRNLILERIEEHLCVDNKVVTEDFISRHQDIMHWRKAGTSLTSTSQIGENISVSFLSGDNILLSEGFTSVEGSEFQAVIGDCDIIELNNTYRLSNQQEPDLVVMNKNADILSSVKNVLDEDISIFPNPTSEKILNVFSSNNTEKMNVQIFDILGKEVINTNTVSNQINISGLNTGVYIVKITEEGKTATRKLVVK